MVHIAKHVVVLPKRHAMVVNWDMTMEKGISTEQNARSKSVALENHSILVQIVLITNRVKQSMNSIIRTVTNTKSTIKPQSTSERTDMMIFWILPRNGRMPMANTNKSQIIFFT